MIFLPPGSSPSPSTREVGAALSLSHLLASHTWGRGLMSAAIRMVAAQTSWVPGRVEPESPLPLPRSGPHPLSPTASHSSAPHAPGPGHPPAPLPATARGRELCRKSRDTHRASSWIQGSPRGCAFWRPRGRAWGGVRPEALLPFHAIHSAVRGG